MGLRVDFCVSSPYLLLPTMCDLQRLSVPSLAWEVVFSAVSISDNKKLSQSVNPKAIFFPKKLCREELRIL